MSCSGAAKDSSFDEQSQKISRFLQQVDHKIVVMSGKGGSRQKHSGGEFSCIFE